MISRKKSMISIIVGSAFAIFSAVPIASAANNAYAMQFMDKSFMVAEAHRHGEGQGGGKPGEGQHDEGKGGDGKRGEGKDGGGMMGEMKGMMKHDYSYAQMVASHADALKLTDTQLGRITRLQLKQAQEHEQFKQKIHKGIMEFHKESMKPGTNDATLRKLAQEHADAFTAMVEQHIKDRNEVNAILSAEQKSQLKAMKMDHDMHGGGHGQH